MCSTAETYNLCSMYDRRCGHLAVCRPLSAIESELNNPLPVQPAVRFPSEESFSTDCAKLTVQNTADNSRCTSEQNTDNKKNAHTTCSGGTGGTAASNYTLREAPGGKTTSPRSKKTNNARSSGGEWYGLLNFGTKSMRNLKQRRP